MKRIVYIVIIALLTSNLIFGQVSSKQSKTNYKDKNVMTIIKKQNSSKGSISEGFFTTAIVIGETFLLLIIVGYWRKTRTDWKVDNKTIFKKNIKALRLERIKRFENETLSLKRKKIQSKLNQSLINGKYITRKAKKLEVSKGEIFLAAKIKQLSRQAI